MRYPTPPILLAAALALPLSVAAQDRLERANPERVEDSRPELPIETPAVPNAAIPRATEPVSSSPTAATVTLTRINLSGLTELSADQFADVLAPFIGRPVGPAEVKGVANAVTERAQALGYVFASATVPPQTVADGTLLITVDEGRVDGVRIEGYDDAFLQRVLDRLAERPVTRARLERQLLLANDGLGVSVGRAEYTRTDAGRFLTVKVTRDPWVGFASIDNWGSRFVGPFRARVGVNRAGVFDGADEARVAVSFTPFQPREYGYGRLGYARRLGTGGTELSLSGSYGKTRLGDRLRERGIGGESVGATVGLSHPVLRSRDASLWTELGLSLRRSMQDVQGVTLRDDRVTTATAGLFGLARLGSGRVSGRVTASRGLDLLGATDRGDPLASRPDAAGRYTLIYGRAVATIPVAPRVEFGLAVEGQAADRPLLSLEEYGIGGADVARGYDYSERLGDEGVGGSAELRYTLTDGLPMMERLQLLAFVDGGVTRDIGVRRFDGSLASAGGGLEVELPLRLTARLTVGVPLTGPRDEGGTKSPRIGFGLATRF